MSSSSSVSFEPKAPILSEPKDDSIKLNILREVPREIAREILFYLSQDDLGRAAQVSRKWKEISEDNFVWKQFIPKFTLDHNDITNCKQYVVDNIINANVVHIGDQLSQVGNFSYLSFSPK